MDCEYTKNPEHNVKCFHSFVVSTPADNWAIIESKYRCVIVNIAYMSTFSECLVLVIRYIMQQEDSVCIVLPLVSFEAHLLHCNIVAYWYP